LLKRWFSTGLETLFRNVCKFEEGDNVGCFIARTAFAKDDGNDDGGGVAANVIVEFLYEDMKVGRRRHGRLERTLGE